MYRLLLLGCLARAAPVPVVPHAVRTTSTSTATDKYEERTFSFDTRFLTEIQHCDCSLKDGNTMDDDFHKEFRDYVDNDIDNYGRAVFGAAAAQRDYGFYGDRPEEDEYDNTIMWWETFGPSEDYAAYDYDTDSSTIYITE